MPKSIVRKPKPSGPGRAKRIFSSSDLRMLSEMGVSASNEPIILRKPEPRSATERELLREQALIQKVVDGWLEGELAGFAVHLVSARILWRQYRSLVESDKIPEHLVAAYHHEYPGDSPYDPDVDYGSPVLSAERLDEFHEMATEFVRRKPGDDE